MQQSLSEQLLVANFGLLISFLGYYSFLDNQPFIFLWLSRSVLQLVCNDWYHLQFFVQQVYPWHGFMIYLFIFENLLLTFH